MAETLNFSLVSPECELFSGEVIHVDVPGTEGDMGIHPKHAPLMAAIRTGIVNVYRSDENISFFVQGGFVDVTTEELVILAEKACLSMILTIKKSNRKLNQLKRLWFLLRVKQHYPCSRTLMVFKIF